MDGSGTGLSRFKAYAVLGDDIVIADRQSRVASEYASILDDFFWLSTEIPYLQYGSFTLEFAKRFFVREGTRDLSPVLGQVIMSKWTIGLALLRG